MSKYKIGDVVMCASGDFIGRKLTIENYRHEYYYHHTNNRYSLKEINHILDENQLIPLMEERDNKIDILLQKRPKYKTGDVLYCIPDKGYDYYLNTKLTVKSASAQIDGEDLIFLYLFEETSQGIKEYGLKTLEELREDKLTNILNE